jgi:hypothetical protein
LAFTNKSDKKLTIAMGSRSKQGLPPLLVSDLLHLLPFNLSAIAIKKNNAKTTNNQH